MSVPRVLGELLADRVKRIPKKVFLRFKDLSVTYEEIDRLSNRFANAFINFGIAKGDKVSIMMPNCPEFIYLWFGLAKCGGVEVPVNTSYKGEFLRHVVDQSDSKILVISAEYLDRVKLIEAIVDSLDAMMNRGKQSGAAGG